MNRFTYTGSLLAVAIGGYASSAYGQEPCERQVEQLQTQVQERELDAQTKQEIEDLLQDAQNASPEECQTVVGEVREQLDAAETAPPAELAADLEEAGSPAAHADPDVHVVESETVAQTGPREQTEAEIVISEPVDQDVRGELSNEPAPNDAATQADAEERPSQSGGIGDAEASELVGKDVRSSDGEVIGEVSEVVRSLADQQVHALVDIGGLLGIGEQTVSIPLERADIGQDGSVTTQMSRDEIEALEEHDPTQYASIDEGEEAPILR